MASVPASTMLPREVSVNRMGAGGRDPERREARETLRRAPAAGCGRPYRATAHGSSLGRSHRLRMLRRHPLLLGAAEVVADAVRYVAIARRGALEAPAAPGCRCPAPPRIADRSARRSRCEAQPGPRARVAERAPPWSRVRNARSPSSKRSTAALVSAMPSASKSPWIRRTPRRATPPDPPARPGRQPWPRRAQTSRHPGAQAQHQPRPPAHRQAPPARSQRRRHPRPLGRTRHRRPRTRSRRPNRRVDHQPSFFTPHHRRAAAHRRRLRSGEGGLSSAAPDDRRTHGRREPQRPDAQPRTSLRARAVCAGRRFGDVEAGTDCEQGFGLPLRDSRLSQKADAGPGSITHLSGGRYS
jgi:hypothetical protein